TDSAQPLTSLTEDIFAATGALTINEAVNELPQLGDALESGSSINALNSGFGVGTQTVNLRNLGANRSLVLVNGRRHVGGDVGTNAVDLNTIPAGLIERIDIVTGASSSIYGADAVTGVVNIILKENFEGNAITFRTGTTSEEDGEEFAINAVHGGTFSNGDYIIALEYSTQGEIIGKDRPFSQFDGGRLTGVSAMIHGSGINPGGSFAFSVDGPPSPPNGGFNADGDFVQDFRERFQRVPFRSLQNETERLVFSARTGFDLNNDMHAFIETSYANSTVEVQFEPQLAAFNSARFGSSGTAGFRFPDAPIVAIAAVSGNLRAITRRFLEFGPRHTEIERDLFRFATGLDGDFSGGDWYISYQYGKVEATQTDFDTIDKLRLMTAIDPVACAAQTGCQFVNIYGRGTIDPASEDWVSDDLNSESESEQHVITAYITGDFLELNGNMLSYVLGGEYRDESATITPNRGLIAVTDPVTNSGNLVGLKGTRTFFGNTDGGYDVSEIFGELAIPLSDRFDVNLSARLSDYSTVGEETTYGVNANWKLTHNIRARGSFGRATRAPNINELYAPTRASTIEIADPCDTATDDGDRLTPAANCADIVGANFNPSAFDQNIRGIRGGNPDLDSEIADTFTIGLVFNLGDSTIISADYFNIDMTDVLADAFTAQATLDRCVATGEAVFCNNVTRDADNIVRSIRSEQINLAEESVGGLEFALQQNWALANGDLILDALFTHLLEHDRKVNDTSDVEDLVGRVDNIENRLNASLRYENYKYLLGASLRYFDSAVQHIDANPMTATGNNIGSITYFDIFGEYRFADNVALRLGVENLFDEKSPVVTQLFENNGGADTTSAGIYDIRGTFGYMSLKYNF
ncbi:MAG: TonB-dependent receptor, partial [Alphaproteobacteria bacterium]|nr:TonB-dependent receptor [Alphaproteobacteria bacterium]